MVGEKAVEIPKFYHEDRVHRMTVTDVRVKKETIQLENIIQESTKYLNKKKHLTIIREYLHNDVIPEWQEIARSGQSIRGYWLQ